MSHSAADNWLKPDKKYDGNDPSMLQLLQGKLNLHAKKHGWEKLLTGAQDATDEMLIEMQVALFALCTDEYITVLEEHQEPPSSEHGSD